jgi:hypothetical protein
MLEWLNSEAVCKLVHVYSNVSQCNGTHCGHWWLLCYKYQQNRGSTCKRFKLQNYHWFPKITADQHHNFRYKPREINKQFNFFLTTAFLLGLISGETPCTKQAAFQPDHEFEYHEIPGIAKRYAVVAMLHHNIYLLSWAWNRGSIPCRILPTSVHAAWRRPSALWIQSFQHFLNYAYMSVLGHSRGRVKGWPIRSRGWRTGHKSTICI